MVDNTFLDNIRAVCADFEASRGETNLFAILKMDEITDKWTIVVSAGWVEEYTFDELFAELRMALINRVGDSMNSIARIGIFTLDICRARQTVRRKYILLPNPR